MWPFKPRQPRVVEVVESKAQRERTTQILLVEDRILRHVLRIEQQQLEQRKETMSALANLNTSIATLQTSVNTLVAQGKPSATDADLQAAQASVDAINAQVQAVIVPPAPAPAA